MGTLSSAPEGGATRPRAGAGLPGRLPRLVESWRAVLVGTKSAGPGPGRLSKTELASASAALVELQRGLTGSRVLAGAPYMDRRDLLGAYLLYYWPVSYLQVSLAVAELGSSPRRVLDLGSGPGPASAALLDAGAERLVLVDASERALGLARELLGRSAETRAMDLEAERELPDGEFDLVVIGHCLNELWRGADDASARRLGLLERAVAKLAPGGRLLVVEPALLATSREAMSLRDALIAMGYRSAGPCPGSFPCPILAAGPERSCHSEAPWSPPEPVASLAAAAGLDRRSVKYSWFAIEAPRRVDGTTPSANGGTGAETGTASGEAASGSLDRARVDSDPMLNKAGRLRYILCRGGSLVTLSARVGDPAARALGFFALRRGDHVRVAGAEARGPGSLGLVEGSSLELLAPAPEP